MQQIYNIFMLIKQNTLTSVVHFHPEEVMGLTKVPDVKFSVQDGDELTNSWSIIASHRYIICINKNIELATIMIIKKNTKWGLLCYIFS